MIQTSRLVINRLVVILISQFKLVLVFGELNFNLSAVSFETMQLNENLC
jgi:hypothetical protein